MHLQEVSFRFFFPVQIFSMKLLLMWRSIPLPKIFYHQTFSNVSKHFHGNVFCTIVTWHFLFPLSWSLVSIFRLQLFTYKKFFFFFYNFFLIYRDCFIWAIVVRNDVLTLLKRQHIKEEFQKAKWTFFTVISQFQFCLFKLNNLILKALSIH